MSLNFGAPFLVWIWPPKLHVWICPKDLLIYVQISEHRMSPTGPWASPMPSSDDADGAPRSPIMLARIGILAFALLQSRNAVQFSSSVIVML